MEKIEEKQRTLYIRLIIVLLAFIGILVVPSLIYSLLYKYVPTMDKNLSRIIAELIYIIILVLTFRKDLIKEFKIFKSDIKGNIDVAFKYYVVGIGIMIVSNLILNAISGGISQNESSVREMLFDSPLYTLISISILAPFQEELVFRKSLSTVINDKYIYPIISALLFGFAHILTNIISNTFVPFDILYIIPYGALGWAFAKAYNETKTTFTNISMHAIHNTATALLLLLLSLISIGA